MGILEKAAAYRWATRGRGGGGGGGELGSVLAILLVIGLAIYAIFAAIAAVMSAIYQAVRAVFLVAPHLTTLLAGLLLVGIVNVVVAYPPDEARKVLSSTDDSRSFYARVVGTIALLNGFLLALDAGFFHTESGEMHGLLAFVFLPVSLYVFYKYFQVLFQTHRLVRCAPSGVLCSTAVFLPITTGLTISTFGIPTNYPSFGPFSLLFEMTAPVVLGAFLVKYRAEPHIGGPWSSDTDANPRVSDDERDGQAVGPKFECLDCRLVVESDSHPKTCDRCGGIVKMSR